jgi:dTMP kinase
VGLLVTFEGGEGVGKTTQTQLLIERLTSAGHPVVGLREPGGTPLGDYLREWLKASDRPLTPEAELFLFTAARAELVRTQVQPALDDGKIMVLDRYADSTTAYQGYGRRLPLALVRSANALATGGLQPDLVVLLDAPPRVALERTLARAGEEADRRFEDADLAFHRRVRAGFKRLARRGADRWLVVDATASADAIAEAVWARVSTLLAER